MKEWPCVQIAHSALSTVGIAGRRVVATGRLDGSSPHTQGTLSHLLPATDELRFIPAYAGNAVARTSGSWPGSVHPRMRGERACAAPWPEPVFRFIPACAGNATCASWASCARSVHPRMCGERYVNFDCELAARGSSPHVRGTRRAPAPVALTHSVHPRMCGERTWRPGPGAGRAGSSPHVRGTRCTPARVSIKGRFIPACAGNAIARRLPGRMHRGSSPHVRGTQPDHVAEPDRIRFIPACAGNAVLEGQRHRGQSVHPRMCGERQPCQKRFWSLTGSSPHVRGTPSRCFFARGRPRFIPACAGNAIITARL